MKLIPLSQKSEKNKGKYFAKVDDEDYEWLMQWKWRIDGIGKRITAARMSKTKPKRKVIFMHREIMKTEVGMTVDHIDHDCLNNQKSNLRNCTHAENCRNRGKIKLQSTSSKYKGVYFCRANNKWVAQVRINYKYIFLGYFDSEIKAALSYNSKARELHGEFANLNLIPILIIPNKQYLHHG